MFWSMQSIGKTEWRYNNLYRYIQHVLDTLQQFLDNKNIPHYFFGEGKNLLEESVKNSETRKISKLDMCPPRKGNISH